MLPSRAAGADGLPLVTGGSEVKGVQYARAGNRAKSVIHKLGSDILLATPCQGGDPYE
jgi:hypothetical protein